jgi:molybdate transport system substrate-binding protein
MKIVNRISIALGLLLACAAQSARSATPALTVFAAASLTNVMQEVGAAWTAQSGQPVVFSFAASSALARQVESGAPADVFVSADQEWMDYLQARQLIVPASRTDIVRNELVLVAPADNNARLKIAPGFGLAAALGASGRLATGDPASVPVGKYAREALTALGVWPAVERRVVAADNVRGALAFVARGEAPFGIVYATDARVEPKVRIVDVFPATTHAPIRYPAAAVGPGSAASRAFLEFLRGPGAQAIFARAGFAQP